MAFMRILNFEKDEIVFGDYRKRVIFVQTGHKPKPKQTQKKVKRSH